MATRVKPLHPSVDVVQTPRINGVTVHRHPLDREASKMATLARRVRIRLERWLNETQAPPRVAGEYESGPATVLPSPEWLASWRWYVQCTLGLLAEQRARAVLKDDARPAMSDEEFERALAEDFARRIGALTPLELAKLMSETKANDDTAACSLDAAPIPAGSPLDAGKEVADRKVHTDNAPGSASSDEPTSSMPFSFDTSDEP